MRYLKPALTFDQQLDLLVGRGLVISGNERLRAMRWLKHISYYRLSAYFLPFKTNDIFNEGTTFHQVAGLYIFDRKLRLILLDAIERIEVALRAALTYEIAHRYGPFGYARASNFDSRFDHDKFMDELSDSEQSSKETFIAHFRAKYNQEKYLPFWMVSELMSFGRLSRIYKACHPDIKRNLARRLDINDRHFASWLHTLNYVRNVCAHHSRLWNRQISVQPALPSLSRSWPYVIPCTGRLYCVLVIVCHCLLRFSPHCRWRARLFSLFDDHRDIDLKAMRIPDNWRSISPWI